MPRLPFRRPRRAKLLALVLVPLVAVAGFVTMAQGADNSSSKRVEIGAKPCLAQSGCRVGAEIPIGTAASLRFNVGGKDFVDSYGNRWAGVHCRGGEDYTSPNAINGTVNDALFQSGQFEARCALPATKGRYLVTLGWAETSNATPGYRQFLLKLEGNDTAIMDVGAAAGMNTTLLTDFPVGVKGDTLDVALNKRQNRPMLSLVMATPIAAENGGAGSTTSTIGLPSSSTTQAPVSTTTPPTTSVAPTTTAPTTTAKPTTTTTAEPTTTTSTAPPTTSAPSAPGGSGVVRSVGPGQQYATLQAALDAAQPGDTVRLATSGSHAGGAVTKRAGQAGKPITISAVTGAKLDCSTDDGRCLELNHSYYVIDGFSISGGTSNLYIVGPSAGNYVHDVVVRNSTFRGESGTGECIRVKYQASKIEIAHNDIADCGLGKCCDSSKSGEGVYIGTAPEQLASKNPSSEPDATHDVWVHHNVIRPYNECVDMKEATHDNLVEYNTCSHQSDPESGAFDSRGGRVGQGNTFRFNVITDAVGACVRFGGDSDPDGTGNHFYGNVCRNIGGYGVKQMRTPQGIVCGNTFEGTGPNDGLSKQSGVDPTAACPSGTPSGGPPGA